MFESCYIERRCLECITSFRKDDVVTFAAHLSVTIKLLTRHKQKVVLVAMLEGKSMPSNMAANTNHSTSLKNESAIKYVR